MGNTLGSYLYDEGETIPLVETERVSYTLARDVSFIKSSRGCLLLCLPGFLADREAYPLRNPPKRKAGVQNP